MFAGSKTLDIAKIRLYICAIIHFLCATTQKTILTDRPTLSKNSVAQVLL